MFRQARLKLTLWYVVIIMAVSLFFSSLVYFISLRELNRQSFRWERQLMHNRQVWEQMMGRPLSDDFDDVVELKTQIIHQGKRNLILSLVYLNGVIIIIAGVSGYFLAGKTLEPIQQNLESQKLFIANAAHELKTPLAIMQTNLEVALDNPKLAKQTKTILKDNLEEVNRLTKLVRQLLSLFTPTPSRAFQPVDLASLVRRTSQRFRRLARQKGIKLTHQLTPTHIKAIPEEIESALAALLDNALKYTPKGGQVSISLQPTRGHVNLIVTDTGAGIKPEIIRLVTQPFYKATPAAVGRRGDSFGLGLALVKKIMTDHKGKLKITSQPGQGTRITLCFPKG